MLSNFDAMIRELRRSICGVFYSQKRCKNKKKVKNAFLLKERT